MVKIKDRWIRIIGIPVFAGMSAYSYTFYLGSAPEVVAVALIVCMLETWSIWEAIRLVIKKVRWRYPDLVDTRKRMIFQFVYSSIVISVFQLLCIQINNRIPLMRVEYTARMYLWAITNSTFILLLVFSIYEAFYFYHKLREKREETARLKKERVEQQLENLKDQINPHFLFNSLNTLSSLISIDAEKANHFLEEMAVVYRYLLRNNEVPLCNLEEELNFIRAYFHLLQTRHGAGVALQIEVGEACLKRHIPPLTLQLLVENAVKHNVVSLSKPLTIRVYTSFIESDKLSERLVVENNLQKKKIAVASNKVGLSNIIEKYALLHPVPVEVTQNETLFRVCLPLIV
ncbi:sensor histidine kinase [Runella slithyformis]|nr:histidine kinase [Runella slithyformis]